MFDRQYRAVLGYALRRAAEADAHDVVADTFLVAWRRLDDMPAADRELAWLLGIARRALANRRRTLTRANRLHLRLVSDYSAAAEGDTGRNLLEALGRLPHLDREVLLLAAWDGLKHKEMRTCSGAQRTRSRFASTGRRRDLPTSWKPTELRHEEGTTDEQHARRARSLRAINPVDTAVLPDAGSERPLALARTIVGKRSRRGTLLAAAALTLLAAVLVATPAFGIRQAISDLLGREDVSFQQAPPAATVIRRDFTDMSVGAPAGMDPQVVAGETRLAATFIVSGHARNLWVAPTAIGGYCYVWEHLGGGCNNMPRDPGKILLDGSFFMGLNDKAPSMEKLAGDISNPDAAGVRLTFEDGRQIPLRLVYVSAPIDAGFFAYNPTVSERRQGHRPLQLEALDAGGQAVATTSIDWANEDQKAAQVRAALHPSAGPTTPIAAEWVQKASARPFRFWPRTRPSVTAT